MSKEVPNKFYCEESAIKAAAPNATSCTDHIDMPRIKQRIYNSCHNKTVCTLNIIDIYNSTTPASITDSDGVCGQKSYVYVQYPCLIPEE